MFVMSDSRNDVVVTGVGPVTAIGVGREAVWDSLAAGRSNTCMRTLQTDVAETVDLPVASMLCVPEIPGLDVHERYLDGQDCPGYRDLSYSLLAMELAIADAGLEYDRDTNRVGMVQAFEAPGVEATVSRLFQMMSGPPPTGGPPKAYEHLARQFYNMQPFLYVHLAGKAFALHGFSTSVHNACASGAFALEIAAQRIVSGQADAMLVVGGEAFDTAVRIQWFRDLGLYAGDGMMRPFDSESSGFYVGEGAGAIVIESAASAEKRGAQVYARYVGGSLAQQGWKQTIPDVRAMRLRDVMASVLSEASMASTDVDLIVPHSASTQLSDGYEAACIEKVFGSPGHNAVCTAFKPYVGHLLAGSGVVETICALLAMKNQTIPATLKSDTSRVELCLPLITERVEQPIKTMLKLSTGFTGHDAASLFAAM